MKIRIAKKDIFKNIHRALHKWLGTNVVLLDLRTKKDGFEVRLGVVRSRMVSKNNELIIKYKTYEIEQPIFLRCKDGAYWLEWPEDYRNKITISRKERRERS